MSRARPFLGTSRRRDERGVALVIVAMSMVMILIIAALVIDVGRMRERGQSMQTAADLAALAAASGLRNSNVAAACQAAVNYFNTNTITSSGSFITPSNFCSQSGNDVTTTTCSGGTLAEAKPSATVNGVTISVHYPVPDSEITSSGVVGARPNDGTACQRLRVVITDTQSGFFTGLTGHSSLTGTRSATIRVMPGHSLKAPALWLLDPTGCTSLTSFGGATVTVGTSTVGGLITVDSDGTTCSSNQNTIASGGSNSKIVAQGPSSDPGQISLDALQVGATVCTSPACNPSDVSAGLISPQPIGAGQRATRAPVDWQFNCKSTYPNYHGIAISGCTNGDPAYMDNLKTALGTTTGVNPDPNLVNGYKQWTKSYSCSPNGTINVPAGNWWIDCGGPQGLKINNSSTNITFAGGNIVMDGPLTMSGGSIYFNASNPNATLPSSCIPPNVTIPCIDNSSSNAAFIFSRAGGWSFTGTGTTFRAEGTSVILNGTGSSSSLKMNTGGSTPPIWHAATEGPFAGLAFWGEAATNADSVAGGGGASLSGIFFAPEAAPFSLSGGSDWGQQAAQFIAYQLTVNSSSIQISPNAQAVKIVPPLTTLIR
jgi:Flp pilus assembly protein TadG